MVNRLTSTALVALLLGGSGCFWVTTAHEGKQIRKNVAAIDKRVATNEDALGSKVIELKEVLAKATKLLTRNSADLGAEVDSLERDMATLNGLVAQATEIASEIKAAQERDRKIVLDRLTELETRLAKLDEQVNKEPVKTASQLFQEGKSFLDSRSYNDAVEAFKTLAVKYPKDKLADDAQYYRGEALYRGGNHQLALGELQKVFEKYPDSNWAPTALYRAGEAALELKWCTDARAYFTVLMQKYPRASEVAKAKRQDRTIKRNLRNKSKCKS
jgi:tol-pal system protein YbgF